MFNTAKTTVVSYDDTDSLADKAKFAKQSGMAGCFTWSLDQVGPTRILYSVCLHGFVLLGRRILVAKCRPVELGQVVWAMDKSAEVCNCKV